jgi:nitrate reductase alpha subunit
MSYSDEYPKQLIEEALGQDLVAKLQEATPQSYGEVTNSPEVADRFHINAGALGYWIMYHFNLNVFNDDDCYKFGEVDPLGEVITVNGDVYNIPHWCYLNSWGNEFDTRPDRWVGFPRS